MKIPAFSIHGHRRSTTFETRFPRGFPLWFLLGAISVFLFQTQVSHAIIDLDLDGLDDVWEEVYGAQAVLPLADDDGDGHNSLNESAAGTDPFDADSCLAVSAFTLDEDSASVTFPTAAGKRYTVQIADKVGNAFGPWVALGPGLPGGGGNFTLNVSSAATGSACGMILQKTWIGTSGTSPASLEPYRSVGLITGSPPPAVPPTGFNALDKLEIAPNYDDNYAGRIFGHVIAPATGTYTFYLTARHSAELLLSPDANFAGAVVVATVDSATQNLAQKEWNTFASQSHTVALTAGQKYFIDLRHIHGSEQDHCAVGWEGPGIPVGSPDPGPIQVIDGQYLCPFTGGAFPPAAGLDGGPDKYLRVACTALDQDGDGLDDWAEAQLSGYNHLKATSTTSGSGDFATVTSAIGASSETIDFSVAEAEGFEDPRDDSQVLAGTPVASVASAPARFRIQRTGTLQPVTVNFTLGGVFPGESAEASDYTVEDVHGNALTGSISLGFGQVSADIHIVPVNDTDNSGEIKSGNEFPEQVSCTVDASAAYAIGSNGGEVTIFDARDIAAQENLFVAFSEPEPGAVDPQGSAVVAGRMNGKKDFMTLNTIISAGFSSPQDDSHIHKAQPGPVPGPIVYEITNIPGEPLSDPMLGAIGPDYPYPVEASAPFTAQQIIDSFYNQDPDGPGPLLAETPMYLNWHTANNAAGELWAKFAFASGSIDPPVHPPMPPHTFLDHVADAAALEMDIFRFLNQATFGATDADVQAIKQNIIDERTTGGNPTYSRIEEYENWIDAQIGLDQTYIVDYLVALKFQDWNLRKEFDPATWYTMANFPDNPSLPPDDPAQTWTLAPIPPIAPGINPNPLMMPLPQDIGKTWPSIDRSPATTGGNPFEWRATDDYPISRTHIAWGDDNDNRGDPAIYPFQNWNGSSYVNNSYNKWARADLARPDERDRYLVHWMMHVNAQDQLRQKMGYALQQICVVANTLTTIQDRDIGMANYQDHINRMAFDKYRDVIDWIMISPQMGWWLSSFNNQKAADLSVPPDGIIDVFPDENLAREVMQLFTCGLFILHPDGSLALDSQNGLPQASYDNDDITELSRVITGHGYGKYIDGGGTTEHQNWDNPLVNNSFTRTAGDARIEHTFNYPMKMFGAFHDTDPKTILGGKIINNTSLLPDTTAVGNADMEDALDWLAGNPGDLQPDFDQVNSHQSTAPFIARRLIQRFVTSNPSPAYLQRVTEAFRDGYGAHGGEGDLTSAIKAILLDWEARDPAAMTDTFGLKKSPYEAYIHMLRAFDAHSQTPIKPLDGSEPASFSGVGNYDLGTNPDLYLESFGYPAGQADNFRLNTQYRYLNTDLPLSMSPMNQPTVFNFYLPDYSPGGVIGASSMSAPEMMLANEQALYLNINYFWTVAVSTSANASGESESDLINVNNAFQVASGATNNERIRIDTDVWGPLLYPVAGTELERDTALFDEMDRRLTGGLFKLKYPWDPGNDDDPARDGIIHNGIATNGNPNTNDGNFTNDDEFMNPREAIITFMRDSYGTTDTGPRDKFRYGLYLLTSSPDYLVRQ